MVHFPHANTVGIFRKKMSTDLLGFVEVFLLHLVFASPVGKRKKKKKKKYSVKYYKGFKISQ